MADNSAIEWTDASWNPIRARNRVTGKVGWFCTHASEGCRNCYAEGFNARLGTGVPYKAQLQGDVEIYLDEAMLLQPLRWKRPRKIFVGSMTDLFGEFVPDAMIDRVFAVMALAPHHTFQVLTKRAGRMREYITGAGLDGGRAMQVAIELMGPLVETDNAEADQKLADLQDRVLDKHGRVSSRWPLPNVWLGVSAEDQNNLDARAADLVLTPAAVRFLSIEPMLGAIDGKRWLPAGRPAKRAGTGEPFIAPHWYMMRCEHCGWVGSTELAREVRYDDDADVACGACNRICLADEVDAIDWVILGGESGPNARPMHPDWAREIRDACAAAGVAFFFKQWGEWREALPGDEFDTSRGRAGKPPAFIVDPVDGAVHCFLPDKPNLRYRAVLRVGKKAAGRHLDGRTHDDFPEVAGG